MPRHPAQVLFAGEKPFPILPAVDHYCGAEKMMRKAMALQQSMGPVFDITLDCEDGAPIGAEREHATLCADLVMSVDNAFGRIGARIHDVTHTFWREDLEILVGRAGTRLAYITLPKPRKKALRDFRIGVLLTHPTAEVDASVQSAIEALGRWCAKQKAKVDFKARPDFDPAEAHRVFIAMVRAATSGRQSPEQFARWSKLAAKRGAQDMSYEAQAARGNTLLHKDWLNLNERRHQMRLAWAEFFASYDVLLCPAAATPAFPHNQQGERWERMIDVNGKPQPSTTQMFWAGYSGMCYLPSTVAPIGFSKEGLPVGVQIVGPQYGDATTIELARLIEAGYCGFVRPGGFE